ncbi:MAG: peptide chain release factor N(5)-glutamine methyltransferase [Clostridia bacterium]|nr:peptide chain release factor N(5)-glutamine methyltransferase [Clostridia bacterium]
MKYLLFPCVYGISGYCDNIKISCILTKAGRYKLVSQNHKSIVAKLNIFFVRGIVFLISGLFYIFEGLFEFDKIYNEKQSKTIKKIQNSLNISAKTIFNFFIILLSLILSMFILGYLPIKICEIIILNSTNILAKRLISAVIKIILLYLIFLFIKLLPPVAQYYKFNGAILNLKKEKVNFILFWVSSSFVATIVLAIFGLTANYWYFFIVNALITILCFALMYEVFVLSNKFKWIKFVFYPFYYLIYKNPSQNETKCVNIVLSEINLNSKQRNNQKVDEESKIPFSEAYVTAKDILQKANKYEASDLDFIFCEVLKKNRAEIKLVKYIKAEDYKIILRVAKRRAAGEPITKIFNHANFYGFDFYVNKDVLSPRQDTERLVETVLKFCDKQKKVLDIGTGSGAIAVSIVKLTGAKVVAVDIDTKALEVASKNAKDNGVKITFKNSDIYSALKKERFDIIVSNPPYIPSDDIDGLDEEVKKHDPLLALDGGDDGLDFYRKIIDGAIEHLNKNGMIFFEVGINQASSVKKLLQKNFKDIRIVKDYNKIDRVVYGTIMNNK